MRVRRKELGLTQQQLAEELQVTFQQVQKYERGTNRVAASRLHQLCRCLKVPPEYFFDVQADSAEVVLEVPVNDVLDLIDRKEFMRLNKAFLRIDNPRMRRSVLALIQAMGPEETV